MAYIDGRLSAAEAADFEREHPEAVAERDSAKRLSNVLKRACVTPPLRNADFLNRQILREIASAAPKSDASAPAAERSPSFFNLWRLVFGAAFCLLIALGVYQGFVRPGDEGSRKPNLASTTKPAPRFEAPPYMAEVLSTKTGDEKLKSRVVTEEGLTMVMIDGLEPMSEEFIF